ncbi:MAG: bifunctional DNA-formamidopyrimidine glycosylase/DNA-(apurinic or apyrimidinic site) lyase [Patescibacteria group bacterium]
MPELPEVETVRRGLHRHLKGRRIDSVLILKSGRETPKGQKFVKSILHKKINDVERRVKLIVIKFEDGNCLIAHLKMTGRFVITYKNFKPQKHDAVIFGIGDKFLVWSDVRKFGYLRYVSSQELEKIIAGYGVEPLEVTSKELADTLKNSKTRKVKVALLDQTRIAGIGNIYADESLYRAGIRPTRQLGGLTKKEREKLAQEIQKLLKEAIAHGGTSINDYVDSSGKPGGFAGLLKVYGRNNEPCRVCGSKIKRIVLAGRGTHHCPKCQR